MRFDPYVSPPPLPSYGFPATAENEVARFHGWIAGFRWVIRDGCDRWGAPRFSERLELELAERMAVTTFVTFGGIVRRS